MEVSGFSVQVSEGMEVSPLTLRFRRDRRQVSGFSAASGLKSGQFDPKTDSSLVESDTRCQEKQSMNCEFRDLELNESYLFAGFFL